MGVALSPPQFQEEIYFIRFAKIDFPQKEYPSIEILNERIFLPETYAFQYVFAKIDVVKEQLIVYTERNKKAQPIYQQKFPLKFTRSKIVPLPKIVSFPESKKVRSLT